MKSNINQKGSVLLDAVLSLILGSIILAALLAGINSVVRTYSQSEQQVYQIIEEKNAEKNQFIFRKEE